MSLPRVEPHQLTPEQVARRFNVSVETVYRWIESGELAAMDVRGIGEKSRWRMSETDVAAFAAKRKAAGFA